MPPTAAFLAALIAWVSAVTGLPAAPLPRVVITAEGPGHASLVRRMVADGRPHWGGMTVPGTIYLPPGWDQRDPLDQAIAAHETAHLLQFASGRHYACTARMEPLAWFVEALYLSRRGIDFGRLKGRAAVRMAAVAEECGSRPGIAAAGAR